MIQPVGYNILVKSIQSDSERRSENGLIIPVDQRQRQIARVECLSVGHEDLEAYVGKTLILSNPVDIVGTPADAEGSLFVLLFDEGIVKGVEVDD